MNIEAIKAKLDELKEDVSVLGSQLIGIAISTHNRYEIFKKTYDEMKRFAPPNSIIVVVDDASDKPCPEATFRFDKNVGIARTKNKCFELLYNEGCEHFFLFDDDCYPICEDWYKPYIESEEVHLNYIFQEFKLQNASKLKDILLIYEDSKIRAYSHTRGCMCYYKRVCLDKVGGMNPIFGRWGYEHPDLTHRIYNAWLTSFRYMDIPDSDKLIYSRDEHTGNANSTVEGEERRFYVDRNRKTYEDRLDIIEYIPFRDRRNIILTCLFSNINDPQRANPMSADKDILKPLIESMKGQDIVILNDFDSSISGNVEYLKVETFVKNVYFQRWISYYRYLLKRRNEIEKVFITDGSDVVMLRNPFEHLKENILYVGDEPEITGCDWMVKHHPHELLQQFIKGNTDVLLNAGLCGGYIDIVIEFINKFLGFYYKSITDSFSYKDKAGCGDPDMGLFNYIARTHFNDRLVHGTQVNTVFKAEKANNVSWFKHK